MEKINGIVIDGKFYEAVAEKDCKDCAFDDDVLMCRRVCDLCYEWDCAFRYSPELTDKINKL